MLIDHNNVRMCLRRRLLKLDDNGRPLPPAALENRDFSPPADGSLWIRESYMPGDEMEVASGMTQCVGIYQVDVMAPSNGGTEAAQRWASLIRSWFPPANSLGDTFDDGSTVEVGIDRSAVSTGQLYINVWYFVPVRITWRTYGINPMPTGLLV